MKESGITRLFLLVCVAVLLGAYGVGLGVRRIRFAGVETRVSGAAVTKQPVAKSETGSPEAGTKTSAVAEQPELPAEQPQEEVAARPDRTEGRRMRGEGMGERFQNMSEEERQEFIARMRERGGRRGGGGGFSQLSDEDREKMRAEMEQLSAKANEMSEEEMQEARRQVMEKYGIAPRGGFGGARRFGAEEGTPPPKGRACFVAETPVWVDGKLVQISRVTAGQKIGAQLREALPLEQVQEHEGTFECRDIVLESGNTIGVVDTHCFMLDSGKWIAAQNLKSGLKLKTLTGTVGIRSVATRAVPYTGKVYNLKVKNSDRYLVGKDVVIVRDY